MFSRLVIDTKRASILRSMYVVVAGVMLSTFVLSISTGFNDIALASDNQTSQNSETVKSQRKYVGTKRCRMCHSDHYESWSGLAKADSFVALMPGRNAIVKRNAGLDEQRDYTTDANCLPCHTVGFGKPGGYEIPDPDSGRSIRRAAAREGVGCESCHGPGSDFVEVMQSLALTGRSYDPSELRPLGRYPVTKQTCQRCHNEHAICMTSTTNGLKAGESREWMSVDIGDHHGYHAAIKLKQRAKAMDSGEAEKSDSSLP